MNLLRKLSDLTVAEKQQLSAHLWIRQYAQMRKKVIQISSYEVAAWRAIEAHEAAAIADMLLVQP